MDLPSFSHEMKVALWVSGALEELKIAGCIGGGSYEATPKGIGMFDQLHASGFRPTESETRAALAAFMKRSSDQIEPEWITLVSRWDEVIAIIKR